MSNYICSYDFDNKEKRKGFRYVVITNGDLDVNNAVMIKNKSSLKAYLKEQKEYDSQYNQIYAIIEVKKWSGSE